MTTSTGSSTWSGGSWVAEPLPSDPTAAAGSGLGPYDDTEAPQAGTKGVAASKAVLGRGLLYTVGTAAPVLSNAVVTPFVTRQLGTAEYGIVATGLVIIQVGMIVAGLGLAAAITRHGILEESGVGGARSLVLRGAAGAVLLAGLAALTARWTAQLTGMDNGTSLALALAAAAGFSMVVNVQSYLRVLDHPLPFVLLSLGSALGGPVLGMALLLLVSPTATAYLTGLALGYLVSGLAGLVLMVRGGPRVHHDRDTRRALRIGLPTVPHQVAIFLASGVLVLVAGWVFGAADAGRLQLAVLIGSAPGVLTSSLNNAWAPVVYRTSPEHRGEVLEHTGRDIAMLTGLAAGFVALAAPLLLAIVAPPSYSPREMTPAVGLVAAGTILSVLYLCNVHLVFASGRSEGLALVTPLSLLVGTGAAWAAAVLIGLAAVGIGMTVTYAAMALGVAVLARRVSPTRWHERALALPMLLGFALCAAGSFLPVGGSWGLIRGAAAAIIAVASVGVLLRVLRR
jgi:O-antigen/teichoic acid export membrane protein